MSSPTERSRDFGDVWLGWTLWRALQLDTLCASLMPEGKESVGWSTMAAVLVIARLCEPSSELHIAESWYRKTALEDILDLPEARVNDDRLYRAHDHLLPHKEAIEQHLRKRMGELFSIDYDLLLYDVTSTYFEGLAEKNDLAKRGHSRDHRSDCKQVCIALVVTREGIPLGYEVFPGNKSDMTTVEHIRIQKSDLSIRPIWHQKAERVQAHILVCFLAYALWKTLEQWQIRAGLGNSPRTILDELHRIQRTDVVLPIAGEGARELRIRCIVRPEPEQAALLDRLGLRLPERMKIPPRVTV